MKEFDLDVFEYRRQKEVKMIDLIKEEQLKDDYHKISFRSHDCGYVDGYIYYPKEEKKDYKCIFMFHGGGMVLRYPEQEGQYCRYLAEKTGRAVINVDYPVAPEFKYPLPLYGTYDFLTGVIDHKDEYHLDDKDIAFVGSSAGATIASDMCILNKDKKALDIAYLVVNYGVFHQKVDPYTRQAKDPNKVIAPSRMQQYLHWYFDDLSRIDEPLASPINAEEDCFPKTLIIGAEYDSLLDDSIELHGKITDSLLWIAPEVCHGFTHNWFKEYDEDKANQAWQMIADFIKESKNE